MADPDPIHHPPSPLAASDAIAAAHHGAAASDSAPTPSSSLIGNVGGTSLFSSSSRRLTPSPHSSAVTPLSFHVRSKDKPGLLIPTPIVNAEQTPPSVPCTFDVNRSSCIETRQMLLCTFCLPMPRTVHYSGSMRAVSSSCMPQMCSS